jgi:phosphate-selective porin OprO/OprP
MRILLLAGASLLALSTPAFAQEGEDVTATESTETPIDSLVVPEAEAAPAAPASTGDPVLDKLNALEARIRQLEARNAQLEQAAEINEGRLQSVETRAAKAAQFTWAPTIADTTGNFTFKPRGVVEFDAVAFLEHKGGYDYNNGTGFRRARIGLEGTALKWWNYRIEVDFAGNAVSLLDAYLQYTKIPKTVITLGQHKAPFGLEANNSDNYNTFLERGMFTNAFGNAGAERRIGISAAYAPQETVNIAIGAFGDNESISRSPSLIGSVTTDDHTPDESLGFNGRATWEPVFDTGKVVHLGLSGYYRTALKSRNSGLGIDIEDSVRLSDRPNVRVDNGNIADSGLITDVKSLRYAGAEAAAVFGPFTLAGEAGRIWLDRTNSQPDKHFTGAYVYGSWFVTGETRPFKGGNFDRVKPFKELGKDGLGAFEIAARYDWLDLSETPVLARAGNETQTTTLGVNWYFNSYAKLMFNWVHFWGDNTPLDPIGVDTKGDALATRLHLDF